MKKFWKTAFAAGVGVLIVRILGAVAIFGIVSLIIVNASKVDIDVEPNSVLDLDFSKMTIGEQTLPPNPFDNLMEENGAGMAAVQTIGILDAAKALETAAVDPNISLLYLRPSAAQDISHLEELRGAIDKFRSSGKPVVAYLETPTNVGLYLASIADRVYISDYHGGMNMFVGLSGNLIFIKDLLDKLGVNVQLIRHGKYKAAGEMFIRNSASAENLEQNKVMVQSLWKEISSTVAGKAGISRESLDSLIDNLALVDAGDFVSNGLASEAVSMGGMQEKLCVMTGESDFTNLHGITLSDYILARAPKLLKTKDYIAVIYLDGEIVDGRQKDQVAGKRFADMIDEVRRDSDVRAVVLRVNSPGGSVVAASEIKDAVDRLKAEKPVIASYGSYAASGGYWVSAGCDRIFSDATTITGSIGVFGIIPDFSKTARDIAHVTYTAVPSNAHSDMYSLMRPLSRDEEEYIQKDIESIYTQFTQLVAEGRKMDVEKVDAIGQGRVWTGRDALENGLVDEIGGLTDALDYASQVGGCPYYNLVSYPAIPTFEEQLQEMLYPDPTNPLVKLNGVGTDIMNAVSGIMSLKEPAIYARMPYMMEIR